MDEVTNLRCSSPAATKRTTKPKEIIGSLYFSDSEPRIVGHLTIGNQHFEIVGLRRSSVRTDLIRRRVADVQIDLAEGKPT